MTNWLGMRGAKDAPAAATTAPRTSIFVLRGVRELHCGEDTHLQSSQLMRDEPPSNPIHNKCCPHWKPGLAHRLTGKDIFSTRPAFRTSIMQPSHAYGYTLARGHRQSPHANTASCHHRQPVTAIHQQEPLRRRKQRIGFSLTLQAFTGSKACRGEEGGADGAFQLAGDGVSRTLLFYNWRLRRRAFPSCALADVFPSTSVATITGTSSSITLFLYPGTGAEEELLCWYAIRLHARTTLGVPGKENPSCRYGMGMGMGMRQVYDRMRRSLWTELFFPLGRPKDRM